MYVQTLILFISFIFMHKIIKILADTFFNWGIHNL